MEHKIRQDIDVGVGDPVHKAQCAIDCQNWSVNAQLSRCLARCIVIAESNLITVVCM